MCIEVAADCPLVHIWLFVIDLDLSLSHDAEIMTSTTYRPEQIRIVLVDSDSGTIGENHARGYELIRCQAVTSLVPAVTATEDRRDVTNASTGCCHRLLVMGPEKVGDIAIKDATLNASSVSIIGDNDVVHTPQIDTNSIGDVVEVCRRRMSARNGMEWLVVRIGV